MINKLKVVLDTDVLVPALVFGGRPRLVTDLVGDKTIAVVTSEELMTELRRIITALDSLILRKKVNSSNC